MTMTSTRVLPLYLAIAAGSLTLGCSMRGSASADASVSPDASASAAADSGSEHHVMTLPGDVSDGDPSHGAFEYAYAYDYDDDGNYARPGLDTVAYDVDPTLARACKAELPEFYFEFDSAKPPKKASRDFDSLASCLDKGELRSASIEVIGHADVRGTDAYNRDLGRERAEAIATELQKRGLSADRIAVITHGESDADAPAYWDDRRVVIRLR